MTADRPPPPDPVAPTQPCVWGCTPSIGWRWIRGDVEWARVCWAHAAPAKSGDYIDDNHPRNAHAGEHVGEPEPHQEELWT